MTIQELYVFLQPLTQFLGTVVLVLGIAAALLAAAVHIIKTYWRFMVAAGVMLFIVFVICLK